LIKYFFNISLTVVISIFFLRYNYAQAGNIEFIYWGAKNCHISIAWEKAHKSDIKSELRRVEGHFVEVMKPRVKDVFAFVHVGKNKSARDIIRTSAPKYTPHFTYMKDGERIFDVAGIKNWRLQHKHIMLELLK
jgi:hypothetical protein